MQRRLSSSEKGKAIVLEHAPAPRKARVRASQPDISALKQRHALTIIGRITNPSVQKVWSLIPFFTDHWKTDLPPVGSDLGLGLFQFQFELESDLLNVLDKQPYHYAKWMVILQRWEPTISPDFPSMLPFWIKIQGLPIHLWSEDTIRSIGEDLGTWEATEITSTSARVRVHVNGRLPIIKKTVVEYDNGDEVVVTLHYEKLEKHCSQCGKLDHELRDCLEAKAQKKALLAAQEDNQKPNEGGTQLRTHPQELHETFPPAHPTNSQRNRREEGNRNHLRSSSSGFSYYTPAHGGERRREDYRSNDHRGRAPARHEWKPLRSHTSNALAQSRDKEAYQSRDGPRRVPYNVRGDSHSNRSSQHRDQQNHRGREEGRRSPSHKRSSPPLEFSSTSRHKSQPSDGGIPLRMCNDIAPKETVENAAGVIRDTLAQYTACADPTESAARRDRVRIAEAQGTIEKNALQMAKIAETRARNSERRISDGDKGSDSRTPLSARLGPQCLVNVEEENCLSAGESVQNTRSLDRAHVRDRLGPVSLELDMSPAVPRVSISERLGPIVAETFQDNEAAPLERGNQEERVPARDRLGEGTVLSPEAPVEKKKRKPGRPAGPRKIVASPAPLLQSGCRKRKLLAAKPPTGQKKQHAEGDKPRKTAKQNKQKTKNIRKGVSTGTPSSSDNSPIVNMLPPSARRRMDFRVPSNPVP